MKVKLSLKELISSQIKKHINELSPELLNRASSAAIGQGRTGKSAKFDTKNYQEFIGKPHIVDGKITKVRQNDDRTLSVYSSNNVEAIYNPDDDEYFIKSNAYEDKPITTSDEDYWKDRVAFTQSDRTDAPYRKNITGGKKIVVNRIAAVTFYKIAKKYNPSTHLTVHSFHIDNDVYDTGWSPTKPKNNIG